MVPSVRSCTKGHLVVPQTDPITRHFFLRDLTGPRACSIGFPDPRMCLLLTIPQKVLQRRSRRCSRIQRNSFTSVNTVRKCLAFSFDPALV